GLLRGAPDLRRLRLRGRLPGRADLPRCPGLPDLRGHQRHPAHPDRAGTGGGAFGVRRACGAGTTTATPLPSPPDHGHRRWSGTVCHSFQASIRFVRPAVGWSMSDLAWWSAEWMLAPVVCGLLVLPACRWPPWPAPPCWRPPVPAPRTNCRLAPSSIATSCSR